MLSAGLGLVVSTAAGGFGATASFASESAAPGAGFEWVKVLPGPKGGESGDDLAVTDDGGVVLVGHHHGLDLDRDGVVDLEPGGSQDPLVVRLDPAGDVVWVRSPRGQGFNSAAGVAFTPDGDLVVVGRYAKDLEFDSGPTLACVGAADGFMARYGGGGELRWAISVGGKGRDGLTDVAVDDNGNIYVTGTVERPSDLDGDGSVDISPSGQTGPLLASYDGSGTLRWVHTARPSTKAYGRTVAVGPDGGVYFSGLYFHASDFDGDGVKDLAKAVDGRDNYVLRFEETGALSWVIAISGNGPELVRQLAFVDGGGLVVAGQLTAPTDFDGDGSVDAKLKGGDQNAFVARYSIDGALEWVRTIPARGALGVATAEDRIAVVGYSVGPFDPKMVQGSRVSSDGMDDAFAALFDGAGVLQRVITISGADDDHAGAAAFTPGARSLFVTGFIRKVADFDGDQVPDAESAALGDIFLARYTSDP
jgi:hypothetical protein